jgi:UDP-N-acetylmuramate--alanine ligase
MTGWVLQEAGVDPTVLAGGTVLPWGGGFRRGGDLTVVEADEYDRAFLRIPHRIAAVTSFDAEHLECYGSVELLMHSFQVFLELTQPGGGVVVPVEHEDLAFWAGRIGRTVLLAGPGGHWDCTSTGSAGWGERYVARGMEGYMPLPGLQNLRNASTCLALAELCGIPAPVAMRALESYPGVARRIERLGIWRGRLVVSDYAHHPREMEASINALRRASSGTLCIVFEPHLFSRTARLADEMGAALAMADRSLVLPVYAAREEPVEGVDALMVAEAARLAGGNCEAVEPSELERVLGDVRAETIVFMGAGDSDSLARHLMGSVR